MVSLDLEMNQPSRKIIEIGYTIGDTQTGEIFLKKGLIVNPKEQLAEFIVKLTHITQEMVDSGASLIDAYLELVKDCEKYGVSRQAVVWGGGDIRTLKDQVYHADHELMPLHWQFGYTEMNIKDVVQAILKAHQAKTQGGLAKALGKFGMSFKGVKHRAIDDSVNTFLLYVELLNRLKSVTVNVPAHAKGKL